MNGIAEEIKLLSSQEVLRHQELKTGYLEAYDVYMDEKGMRPYIEAKYGPKQRTPWSDRRTRSPNQTAKSDET